MAIDLYLTKEEWKYVTRASGRQHVIITYIPGEVVRQESCAHNLDTPVKVLYTDWLRYNEICDSEMQFLWDSGEPIQYSYGSVSL